MKNSAAQRYLRQVKWRLVCPRSDQKRLEAQVRTMVLGFAEEYPEAKYEQYIANFGSPQVFACSILDDLDLEQVLKTKRRHRLICWGLAAFLVTVLAAISVFWCVRYKNIKDFTRDGDIIIIEYPAREITEDEFQRILDEMLEKNGAN